MWSLILLSCLKSVEPQNSTTSQSVDTEFWLSNPGWSGVTELPNEMTLAFDLHFTVSEGQLTATMDIPMQNATGLELSDLTVTSDSIDFVLKPPRQPKFTWAYYSLHKQGELEWEGTLTQMEQTFPTTLSVGTVSGPYRPQTPVAPFPYEENEIRIPMDDGVELVGTWVRPSSEPTPLVIMITGSGPQDRDETLFDHKPFAVLADHFARNGISSIRLDDRGVGESAGSMEILTTLDFANDSEMVLKYVQNLDSKNSSVGLLGHSEGGVVAAIVASRNSVDFVVSMAGTGVNGLELLSRQVLDTMGVTDPKDRQKINDVYVTAMGPVTGDEEQEAMKALILAQYEFMGQEIDLEDASQQSTLDLLIQQSITSKNHPWMQTFLTLDPAEYWSKVSAPVLILNGSKDVQVAGDINPDAIKSAIETEQSAVSIEVFEGLNHLFQTAETGAIGEYALIEETIAPVVLQRISDWIVEQSSEVKTTESP